MSALETFFGGLTLEQSSPAALPIENMPLPAELEFKLAARSGNRLRTCVSRNDSVVTGQPLAQPEGKNQTPLLSSACGTVSSIEQDRLIILTDQQQTDHFALPANNDAIPTAFADKLFHCGVQGLGGAAFPGYAKVLSLAGNHTEFSTDTLIINAAECEPLICCDQALIQESASALAHAIVTLSVLLKAARTLVAIEDCHANEIALLSQALASPNPSRISVKSIPTVYPSGSERQLVKILTGIEIAAGQLPHDYGILNFNIATALAAVAAWENDQPQTSRVVTVAGDALAGVRNIRARFGTRLEDLLQFVGIDGKQFSNVTVGGPLSGYAANTNDTVVSAASNCILVNHPAEAPTVLNCIRCGECDKVCPAQLLPQQLHWFCNSNNLTDAKKFQLNACIECGCCDYVCPSNIPLTRQFRDAKHVVADQQRTAALAKIAQLRFDAREIRLQKKAEQRELRLKQRKAEVEKRNQQQAANQSAPGDDAIAAALARARERKLKRQKPG